MKNGVILMADYLESMKIHMIFCDCYKSFENLP